MTAAPSVVVRSSEAETARALACWLHERVTEIVAEGREARLALSGGRTPWAMLRAFAALAPPWDKIAIFQVDERFVPIDDPRSNAGQIARILPPAGRFRPIPVDVRQAPEAVAQDYEDLLLQAMAGEPVFDIVHLGLGEDGHTASLVPGDPILEVGNRWVAATTAAYQGARRVSLTYPTLRRAGRIAWLVTGPEKKDILRRFLKEEAGLPACRVPRDHAFLFTDDAAWGGGLPERSPASDSP